MNLHDGLTRRLREVRVVGRRGDESAGVEREHSLLLELVAHADAENARAVVWEHGRRNFRLRDQGLLRIVCPMSDDTDVCGIGIFAAPVERVKEIMDDDPGVRAGVFVYEAHPCRSFPGDALPTQ